MKAMFIWAAFGIFMTGTAGVGSWILATGFWVDANFWVDSAVWID